MADRDAFIVICWLAILALMFFECFYRKLKNKFNRDVQPPRLSSSSISVSERESCREDLPPELTRHYHHNDHHDRNNNRGGGTGGGHFIGPISITSSSKEMCRISMEMGHGDDEEPPPSYKEALSYAKLVTKFHFSPYGDTDIRHCEEVIGPPSSTYGDDGSGCTSSRVLNLNDHHSSDSCTSAKCAITAAFPANQGEIENSDEEEEEEDDEEDETDESSDSLTDVDSDTETLINDRVRFSSTACYNANNDECNNVIMSSSFSISKTIECLQSEKNNKSGEFPDSSSASSVKLKPSSRELSSMV